MLRIGLSGGIGSGKSTVSARLAELGAVVIDADLIAREVVEPGTPGLAEIAKRFGPDVIAADGSLDRPALGAIVFADESARRDLEAITHPRIHERSAEMMTAAAPGSIVVHDIPLLVEMGREARYALTVIVDVPEQLRLERLVELRGMPEDQARARIAAQADDEARRAAADVLVDNSGSVQQLHETVDRLWHERLVPFEAALREGRVPAALDQAASVDQSAGVDQGADVDRATSAKPTPHEVRRAMARLRVALGDLVVAQDPTTPTLMVDSVESLGDPAVQKSLRDKGFLVEHEHPGSSDAEDQREGHATEARRRGGPGAARGARRVVWVDPLRPVSCCVQAHR